MKKIILIPIAILFLANCSDSGLNLNVSEIEQDFSHIEDPRERWEAYQLEDYYIEQTWVCECQPPSGADTYILQGKILQYIFHEDPSSGRDKEYRATKIMTVDEAFDLIESYQGNAYSVEIKYHPRFGYPTEINIDIMENVADEEIHHNFRNLKRIN
ncbi:MAG: hypothetical protein FH748_00455 [Balneolaceae bacterium]|nr:hypothetical protein [Balneolaceae bacterium]